MPSEDPMNESDEVAAFRVDAQAGDAEAQFNLGVMYDRGQGVPQDDVQAAEWYRKAAEQGHAGAQHNLGSAYYDGRGVPRTTRQRCRGIAKPRTRDTQPTSSTLG